MASLKIETTTKSAKCIKRTRICISGVDKLIRIVLYVAINLIAMWLL